MNITTSLFDQAQLAEAAYANFIDAGGNVITNNADVIAALQAKKFSEAQATDFTDHWQVVSQYTAPPGLFGITDGTGWVSADDGFLVRDVNGNGTIDSGRELFGDNTIKSNGQLATDGFDALADLDSISNGGNADGRISNADAQFANLRVWRDLNQDGISQSNELFTLSSQNIASINVTKTANSQTLANGNQIADLGSFTRTDGSTGTAGAVTRFNLYTQINDAEWRIVA